MFFGKIIKFAVLTAVFSISLSLFSAEDPVYSEFIALENTIKNKDAKGAFALIQKLVSKKSPASLLMMSKIYANGAFGKEADRKDSFQYLEKSARAGYRPAMVEYARRQFHGRNPKGKANEKAALEVCRDAKLLHAYALMLEKLDPKEQKKLVNRVKNSKEPDSVVIYAYCLLRGRAVDADAEEAVKILEGTAKQRKASGEVHYVLARCYADGLGTEADMEKATAEMKKALDLGCPQALFYVISDGTKYAIMPPHKYRFSRKSRSADDDDDDDSKSVFVDLPQVYDFSAGKLATAYMTSLPSGKFTSLLNAQHIDMVKKLADAGDIAMIAMLYDICRIGIGGITPSEEEAEKWFNKRKTVALIDSIAFYGSRAYASYKSTYREFPDNRSGIKIRRKTSPAESASAESAGTGSASVASATPLRRTTVVAGTVVTDDSEWADPDDPASSSSGKNHKPPKKQHKYF